MEQTREVYIGNGNTINVSSNKDVRYYLDIYKLEELVKNNPDKKIVVGASGDWYWTAHDVKDIEKVKSGDEYFLNSSDWSKFHAEIDDENIDLTIEIPLHFSHIAYRDGYMQGKNKVEQWLENIYTRGISKMKYEKINEMTEELKPIILKYINEVESGSKD